jgi:uncharacterized protein (DUF1810 family)
MAMDGTQKAGSVADSFNLERFVQAQGPCYSNVLRELQQGRKTTHWMWFIFPQLRGLGYSSTSRYYAISGRDEAQQYLGHPLLGARLVECSRAVLSHAGRSALDIFGSPDDVKLRSCMTLFEDGPGADTVFAQVLDTFFHGERDAKTLKLLGPR